MGDRKRSRASHTLISMLVLISMISLEVSANQNRKSCLKENSYGLCIKCNREFFLEDNLCYLCSDGCNRCGSRDRCADCFNGYRIDKNGKCLWVVFDITLYCTVIFAGLTLFFLVAGAVLGRRTNLLSMLSGDDFSMPPSSIHPSGVQKRQPCGDMPENNSVFSQTEADRSTIKTEANNRL